MYDKPISLRSDDEQLRRCLKVSLIDPSTDLHEAHVEVTCMSMCMSMCVLESASAYSI